MTAATAPARTDPRERAAEVCRVGAALREHVARRIVGLDETVEQVLISVLCEQHALLEGVPGLAKTLLVSTVADLLDCTFRRIQFTPDLMPGDVTGGEILGQDATGKRAFRFLPGPLFANMILADEINRTPPKTQAALMEAMEERQVTSLGVRRPLDRPFLVLATQNPIEQTGTYPLPVAQLDRFLLKIRLGYPSPEQEARIVRLTTATVDPPRVEPLVSKADLVGFQGLVARTPASPDLVRYAVNLVRASRPGDKTSPPTVIDYVTWGAGPRAAQALVVASRARALLRGRGDATAEDLRAVAPAVFRHRYVMSYAAEADAVSADVVTQSLLEHVAGPGGPAPKDEPRWAARLWRALIGTT